MSPAPRVSIVIPTHERPVLLRRALASVVAQTYEDWEAIVVDDAVSGSAELIVADYDPRIRYMQNDGAHGGAGARNRGIREARGEYIAFLDDDDEWLPEKMSRQITALDAAPADVMFCATAAINVFDYEERLTDIEDGIVDFSDIALRRFKGFLTSTLMIRRSVLDEVGVFDASLPSHQEAELVIRITQMHPRGVGISMPLVRMNMVSHRAHIGGDINRRIKGRELVLAKHSDIFQARPILLAQHLFWLGIWYRDAGRYAEACDAFRRAWRLHHKTRYLLYWLLLLLKSLL